MRKLFVLRSAMLVPVVAVSIAAFAATGCGGDSGSETSSSDSAPATTAEPTATDGATFDQVLACLQGKGVAAEDQSSNISGETIGIDYSGGRTTISFEASAEDAAATATAAESYGEVLTAGTVVASLDSSPEAAADTDVIQSCISG